MPEETEIKEATRQLSVNLNRASGSFNLYLAFINGKRIIASTNSSGGSWNGKVKSDEIRLKVRVCGIDDATYVCKIDLPGTQNDHELKCQLEGGYHEFEIRL